MEYPWANSPCFELNGCMPCCFTPVCTLVFPNLFLDGTDTPFADLSTAEAAMADQVISCLIEIAPSQVHPNLTAAFDGDAGTITVADDLDGDSGLARVFLAPAYLLTGTASMAFSLVFDAQACCAVDIWVYDEEWTEVDYDGYFSFGPGPSFSGELVLSIPADGCYFFLVSAQQVPCAYMFATTLDLDLIITAPGVVQGAIVAAYTAGTSTAYLECVP